MTPWLQPTRLLCPWDPQGKNTGVGCHCPLHHWDVRASHYGGFSCYRGWTLSKQASVSGVHRFSCLMACEVFLDQGSNCIARWILNHGPPERSQEITSFSIFLCHSSLPKPCAIWSAFFPGHVGGVGPALGTFSFGAPSPILSLLLKDIPSVVLSPSCIFSSPALLGLSHQHYKLDSLCLSLTTHVHTHCSCYAISLHYCTAKLLERVVRLY